MAVRENDSGTGTQRRQEMRDSGALQRQQTAGTADSDQIARGGVPLFMSPFTLLDRLFNEELTGLFRQSDTGGGLQRRGPEARAQQSVWAPRIDVAQRGQDLVVRADLPGVDIDNIRVEVADDAITISGERQEEHREADGGVYRVERRFGSFLRTIPLPQGAMVDEAKAAFHNGVLEITIPAPPEQLARGRRIEISGGEDASGNQKRDSGADQRQR
jgi:HSP20 family protein